MNYKKRDLKKGEANRLLPYYLLNTALDKCGLIN